ncbi:hypothetical protein A9762_07695 [Pandoraea sp. ISTKB]|nr:hypothetical protein A9762_07695 [Pandoraea sp. ISTKB]
MGVAAVADVGGAGVFMADKFSKIGIAVGPPGRKCHEGEGTDAARDPLRVGRLRYIVQYMEVA